MATLTLSIPDQLLDKAKVGLSARGDEDIEEFLLSALEAISSEGEPIDADTEAKLLAGLDSPAEKMTDKEWDDLHQRIERTRKV